MIQNKIVSEKEKLKIRLSLLRYLKRMSFRCTPFGTSAGISIGGISKNTGISICKPLESNRLIRPDMFFLGQVYQMVLNDVPLRKKLLFSKNNTLFLSNDEIRYYEYSYEPYRTYKISSVESVPILALICSICEYPVAYQSLLTKIVSEGYEPLEASDYLDQLIDSKLLISNLEPSVSGIHYGEKLLAFLNGNKSVLPEHLDRANSILEDILDVRKSRNRNDLWYKKIISDAETIGIRNVDVVQVDLFKEGLRIELDQAIFENFTVAIRLIKSLIKQNEFENVNTLKTFMEEFEMRYEGMEKPLLEIMDPHVGIGYPYYPDSQADDYLIKNLELETSQSESLEISSNFNLILRKYFDCIHQGNTEIVLTMNDLKEKEESYENNLKYEGMLNSLISVTRNQDSTKIFHVSTEPAGLKPLGRFAYAHHEIQNCLKRLSRLEQEFANDEIIAEILFIPEDGAANLISKPAIASYEIPIVGSSSLPIENQISLNDILVSIVNGRIQLRSRRLNKKIRPIFTSAYNHAKSNTPIFRFLCDLEYQNRGLSIMWDWGVLGRMPFLPRVSYKNIILAKATWKIRFEYFVPFLDFDDPKTEIEKYFIQNKIPNSFVIVQGDHALPIQLYNEDSYLLFIDELKKNGLLVIQENSVSSQTDCVVHDGDGSGYMNEIILLWSSNLKSKYRVEVPQSGFNVEKLIPPGGPDFIYFKIYCNSSMADSILRDHIKPWFDQLSKAGVTLSWFFIRYADPQFHLRIRVFSSEQSISKIRSNFFVINALVSKHKKSWKIQEDTYNREWQRYGKANMKNVEDYFYIDSDFVMNLICVLSYSELQSMRWKIALLIVNSVLDDFAVPISQKAELMTSMEQSFLEEFGSIRNNKLELSKKFRRSKTEIESALLGQETNLSSVYELLEHRKERIKIVVDKIDKLNRGGELGVSLFNLVSSIIHMSLNRIFESKHRMQEMVIYSFLSCHYKSEIARAKYKITPTR
jgi:thiopeptide-type bacteriocin biosynthesis protein